LSTIVKTLLNEALLIKSYENDLNEILMLFENEGPITFEWDIAKERIDKAKKDINTPKKAELFLKTLIDKFKKLPKKIKMKLVKYGVISLIGLLSMSSMNNILTVYAPEIKDEVMSTISNKVETPPTKINTPTSASDSLINFIKNEEGDEKQKGEPVLTAYKLGDKMVTVGWGHAEKIRTSQFEDGQTITRAEAEKLLRSDIKKAEDAINDVLSGWDDKDIEYNINQDMYDAMVSMAFNMGRSGFRNSHFIQLVKRGKYEKAKDEIMKTSRRSFRKFPGLKDRREKEANFFASGLNKLNGIEVIMS
jgi:GH24 family phage-related lysozyme (muramidase)